MKAIETPKTGPQSTVQGISGAGMDRQIVRSRWSVPVITGLVVAVAAVAAGVWLLIEQSSGRSLVIANSR